MRNISIKLALISLLVLLMSCAVKTSPRDMNTKQSSVDNSSATNMPFVPEKKAWETEWERVLKLAKKEGKVVISSVRGPDLVQAVREAFFNKYGIQLEHVGGQGPTLHQRIVTEYKAGVTGCDVYLPGTTGLINVLKPAGAVEPIDQELIFPDVTDPEQIKKVWPGGALDWIDKEHTGLAYLSEPNTSVVINTDLVKPDEIKSYRDLLNPKWQGRIIMDDPSQPGSGQNTVGFLGDHLLGWDFVKDLVNQKPMISRDHRLMADWLAHGKYAISVGVLPDSIKEFQRAGVPLKFIIPKEGTYRSTMGSIIVLPKGRPHPNAARVFINWTLSAEAGAIWTKWYATSSRSDVSKENVDPIKLFQPGVEYFNSDTEEWTKKRPDQMAKAREVFAPLLK